VARPRAIDEHAAHHGRRQRQEMTAVAPRDTLLVDHPQVGLVDEGGRLQRPAHALPPQAVMCHVVQLAVERVDQTLLGVAIPAAPCLQQVGDLDRGTRGRRRQPRFWRHGVLWPL
jgi:hypothetical protein